MRFPQWKNNLLRYSCFIWYLNSIVFASPLARMKHKIVGFASDWNILKMWIVFYLSGRAYLHRYASSVSILGPSSTKENKWIKDFINTHSIVLNSKLNTHCLSFLSQLKGEITRHSQHAFSTLHFTSNDKYLNFKTIARRYLTPVLMSWTSYICVNFTKHFMQFTSIYDDALFSN